MNGVMNSTTDQVMLSLQELLRRTPPLAHALQSLQKLGADAHRGISTSLHSGREMYVVVPLCSQKNFSKMHLVSEEIRSNSTNAVRSSWSKKVEVGR